MTEQERLEIIGHNSSEDDEKIEAAVLVVFPLMQYPLMCGFVLESRRYEGVHFKVYDSKDIQTRKTVGIFQLKMFPNCGSIVVSTGSCIYEPFKGKGIGRELNKLRTRAMSLAGFERIMATVRTDNDIEEHILAANGWKRLSVFDSRYGSQVSLWERVL